jgi:NADPH2:quinone reductase
MRAVWCEELAWPPEVSVVERSDPQPGPGEVLVAVRAAALNFPDVLIAAGTYQLKPRLPFTPGSEFAGDVLAVGSGVTDVTVGTPVTGGGFLGAFAEQIVVPAATVRPMFAGLDYIHAAAFGVAYRTAYHALVTIGGAAAADRVVVLGAAGGVGLAAVDIAHRLGCHVVATASSPERVQQCLDVGADVGVDYTAEDLKTRSKELTDGGADVAVDPVGGPYAEQALRAMRWGGRFVVVGFASGEIPRIPLNLVLLKGVRVCGFEIRTLPDQLPDAVVAGDKALAELVAAGMRPHVSRVYPLTEAAAALRAMAERRLIGKVVLVMGEDSSGTR